MAFADERVLFVLHLPKCGGRSLNQLIFRSLHEETGVTVEDELFYQGVGWFTVPGGGFLRGESDEIDEKTRSVLERPDLRAFVGHLSYGIHRHLPRPWTYCTMLRHPVDRILSLHNHLRYSVRLTIEEFVREPPFREVDNDQTRRISGDNPEIGGCTDGMLQKAKEHLQRHFAVVGVTERYEETVVLLSRTFGWKADRLSSQRENVSRNRMQASDLPYALIETILERNELDLKLHEFACGLLEEAVSRQDAGFEDDVRALMATNASLQPSWFLD